MARAEERAAQLGLEGAAFPWRTIAGEECSAYWPAGTAAFHVNADIAAAVIRYVDATDDREFERTVGLELLVGTARLWRSLGHHDHRGRFRIDGVTGPDEYSAVADNNVYTNLMAQQNLRAAADAAARHPRPGPGARASTTRRRRRGGTRPTAMFVPYDAALGVHPQAEGFTDHQVWDFDATPPDHYPLFLHYPYFDLYRKQVVKQADLVLALHLRGDAFTPEEKARDFDYYERLTVRDSSLSACTQAVVAAEVGHLGLAFDYLRETALIDLRDLGQQHPRRPPPGRPGRHLVGGGVRLRRPARPRRSAVLRPPAAGAAQPHRLRAGGAGPEAAGRDHPHHGLLRPPRRGAAGGGPPRPGAAGVDRGAGRPSRPGRRPPTPSPAAAGPGAGVHPPGGTGGRRGASGGVDDDLGGLDRDPHVGALHQADARRRRRR